MRAQGVSGERGMWMFVVCLGGTVGNVYVLVTL